MVIKLKKRIFILALLTVIILVGVMWFSFANRDKIYIFYRDYILKAKDDLKINTNVYYKDKDYLYVQNTNDFVVKDKQQILNIYYTVLNSGEDSFTFYCDKNYKNCMNDVIDIAYDKTVLSNINNFVHPYNSFKKVKTTYTEYDEITIRTEKNYSEEDIKEANKKVDEILHEVIKNNMNDKEKIKAIHDYIINNGKYVPNKTDGNFNKANDILIKNYGLCSAYSDAMAIFLERLGIDNYKIASDTHVWNLVKLNNTWYHLDLTWDDPVTSDGSDRLEDIFFLINDKRLKELNVKEHTYDKDVYLEIVKGQ